MQGMLTAPLAEFIELEFLRLFLLVQRGRVISPLAVGAGHAYDIRH
jgi:hypothetical protein